MPEPAPLIVSISGIRGLVGVSLTPEVVRGFAAAFGTTLAPGSRVVLARDTRPSGESLAREAARALQQTGCRVLDLGVCPTPAAKLMLLELGADAGLVVTASHNPAPWNGLKLLRGDGVFLNAAQSRKVEQLFHSRRFRNGPGAFERLDPLETRRLHLERILAQVDAGAIRGAGLSAAVDPCNGTGALLLPALLDELGVKAFFINAAADGRFAHDPEPVPANLAQLGEAVRRYRCDLGFALDPDADRVALVGPRGQALGEDYTLALALQSAAPDRPGPIVTTLSTSQLVSDTAAACGRPVVLTPVGEVHVVEKMIELDAAVGGEGNGGVVLAGVVPGRDAAVGVALVLETLARSGATLDALVAALPHYHIDKRKVRCSPARLECLAARLRRRHPKALVHPVADGVKLYLQGRLCCPWIHLRLSNTEPIARLIAESQSAAQARALCDEAEALLAKKE